MPLGGDAPFRPKLVQNSPESGLAGAYAESLRNLMRGNAVWLREKNPHYLFRINFHGFEVYVNS